MNKNYRQKYLFIINGCIATLIHYVVLEFNIKILMFKSMAFATTIACCIGTIVSFIGNKYFVFKFSAGDFSTQLLHFSVLYFFIALFHGLFIYFWADLHGNNYRFGFLIATALQVLITYNYNKILIFKK